MRVFSPRTLIVAALFAATGARAADLTGAGAGSTVADFSGLGIGLDAGAAIGSANGSTTSGGVGGAHVGYNLQNGPLVGGVEADAMLEAVIEAGGENVESGTEQHEVTTSIEDFGAVRDALEKNFGEPESAKLTWKPQTLTAITGEPAQALFKLIDALEDNDDVQTVFGNEDIPEAELEKLIG